MLINTALKEEIKGSRLPKLHFERWGTPRCGMYIGHPVLVRSPEKALSALPQLLFQVHGWTGWLWPELITVFLVLHSPSVGQRSHTWWRKIIEDCHILVTESANIICSCRGKEGEWCWWCCFPGSEVQSKLCTTWSCRVTVLLQDWSKKKPFSYYFNIMGFIFRSKKSSCFTQILQWSV